MENLPTSLLASPPDRPATPLRSAGRSTRCAAALPRAPRRPLHGVLLLDKPLGWSSNDALQKVKGMLRAEKGGHTGTLDPLASGLLPLCFGAATKFSQASLDADKTYLATVRLGQTRVGGDGEGEILETRPVDIDEAALRRACDALTGPIEQVPPMHSALKHAGRPLYDYARAGIEVERVARKVTVHRLDILRWDHASVDIEARVSKGTYLRTLAEDLGRLLGCGAHLSALRRTTSGTLDVAQAVTIDVLQAMNADEREALLRPPDAMLAHWPAIRLEAEDAARFLCGLRRRTAEADCAAVRVYGPAPALAGEGAWPEPARHDAFLGSGHVLAGELIPGRLLSPLEVQALLRPPDPGRPGRADPHRTDPVPPEFSKPVSTTP